MRARRSSNIQSTDAGNERHAPFWEFVAGPLHAGAFGANAMDKTFGPQWSFQRSPGECVTRPQTIRTYAIHPADRSEN
jgi:phosphodiesterase/alkaline phosphatase D-like protein